MSKAAIERNKSALEMREKAPWITPMLVRIEHREAEGGDSFAGDNGGLS